MANYKAVDAQRLDADLGMVADAIRERAGSTGKLVFPDGMAEAVKNIPSGAELPILTNPGSAGDLAKGKQMLDSGGKVVEGIVSVVAQNEDTRISAWDVWDSDVSEVDEPYASDHPGCAQLLGHIPDDMLVRKHAGIFIYAPKFIFGDARPEDVRKGVIFSSGAGIKVEGTMEPGSGGTVLSIEGETLVFADNSTAAIENETLTL